MKKNTWKYRKTLENPKKFKISQCLLELFVKIREFL